MKVMVLNQRLCGWMVRTLDFILLFRWTLILAIILARGHHIFINTSKIVNDINVWNDSNSSSMSWNCSTRLKYFISSMFIEYGELLTHWRRHLYKLSCSLARQLWNRDKNPPPFSEGHMNYSGKLTGGLDRQQLHSNLNSRGKWIFLSRIYFE